MTVESDVLVALMMEDGQTSKQLIQIIGGPERTVRWALNRLHQKGNIQKGYNLQSDMRTGYWRLIRL